MNSTNQLEEGVDVNYATFLVPIQEGLNKHYIVQQLPSHAGDDPVSGLITAWKSIQDLKKSIINKELPAKTPRTAIGIADAALQHIKDRASTYDSPEGERSALKTAQAFNAITGKDLTEAEVFLLLQILKDVRQWQKGIPHQDSLEDCIAYAALKAEAKEKEG